MNIRKFSKLILCLGLFLIFWLPFLIIVSESNGKIIDEIKRLAPAESALIFGAHLTPNGELSEILLERLEAGLILYEKGLVQELVVSDTKEAAETMKKYLLKKGVRPEDLYVDSDAETTIDTCYKEKKIHPAGRKIIFISQGYHLPRLIFQCQQIGVQGIGFPAEKLQIIEKSPLAGWETYYLKTTRIIREAALDWLVIFNIYK